MSLGDQSFLVFISTLVVYLIVAGVFISKGWLIRAGFVMTAISFAPLVWQFWFTDSDAKGFAILLMLLVPPAWILIALGLIVILSRLARQYWTTRYGSVK